jgi:hypothetical protein
MLHKWDRLESTYKFFVAKNEGIEMTGNDIKFDLQQAKLDSVDWIVLQRIGISGTLS